MGNEKRHNGIVRSFANGWGFIDYNNGESVFVHHTNIDMDGYRELFPMDKVTFIVGIGSNGKKQAMNVVVEQEA